MGPIRAEGDPVDAHGGDHVLDVVLPERVDPNMAPEGLDGVFGDQPFILRPMNRR